MKCLIYGNVIFLASCSQLYNTKKDFEKLKIEESTGNLSVFFPIKSAYRSLDLNSVKYIQDFWKKCAETEKIEMPLKDPENHADELKLTENQHMHMIFGLVLDKLFANESFNYKNKFELYGG